MSNKSVAKYELFIKNQSGKRGYRDIYAGAYFRFLLSGGRVCGIFLLLSPNLL